MYSMILKYFLLHEKLNGLSLSKEVFMARNLWFLFPLALIIWVKTLPYFTQMIIFSPNTSFWTKKGAIWWLFHDNLRTRERAKGKGNHKFRAYKLSHIYKNQANKVQVWNHWWPPWHTLLCFEQLNWLIYWCMYMQSQIPNYLCQVLSNFVQIKSYLISIRTYMPWYWTNHVIWWVLSWLY